MFTTRARAKRAIRLTLERTTDFEERFGRLSITRVESERDKPST
jgi:hypothetical protein